MKITKKYVLSISKAVLPISIQFSFLSIDLWQSGSAMG
jgi:hypothetical protein